MCAGMDAIAFSCQCWSHRHSAAFNSFESRRQCSKLEWTDTLTLCSKSACFAPLRLFRNISKYSVLILCCQISVYQAMQNYAGML